MPTDRILEFTLTAIAAGLGAYLGAYLKAKAERQVIREEFAEILQQLDKTVRLTEQIKTQVSGGFWLAQEKWKLRRDLYLALLHNIESAAMALGQAMATVAQGRVPDSELMPRLRSFLAEMSKAKASAHLVSDEAVRLIERSEMAEIAVSFERTTDEMGRLLAGPQAEMFTRMPAAVAELAQLFGRFESLLNQMYLDLAKASKRDLRLDVQEQEGS